MSFVLLRRAVADRKRWLVGWGLGIAAYLVLNVVFYPSVRDQSDEMNKVFDNLPESVRSLIGFGSGVDPFSPVGYLSSQVYQLALPLLLLIAGISVAGSLAGDEEHGLLETTYSLPVSRRRVLAERFGAIGILVTTLSAIGFVATAATAVAVDLGVGLGAMAWASVAVTVLALAVASFTLAVGALTGRRAVAVSTAAAAAVAGYLITSLGDAGIEVFRTLRPLSVFSHYDVLEALQTGRPSWSLLVLVVVAVVSLAVAVVALDRRDLRNA